MSKTSYGAAATSKHELTEAELDLVAGGNPLVVWGIVLAGCALDALTDGAFTAPAYNPWANR